MSNIHNFFFKLPTLFTMSATTSTLTAVTKLVRACRETVLVDQLISQPTHQSVHQPIDQLASFASHFSSSKWGGRHGYLSNRPIQSQNVPRDRLC